MRKAHIKMFDPEGNFRVIPVTSEEHAVTLVASGWRAAESYTAAKKRNYPVLSPITFSGSVRFHTARDRLQPLTTQQKLRGQTVS